MEEKELLRCKMMCVDLIKYINDLKQRKKEIKEDKRKEKNSVQGMNREMNNIDNKIAIDFFLRLHFITNPVSLIHELVNGILQINEYFFVGSLNPVSSYLNIAL